ncbi:MAG: helix-turn-helix transcriptional regulator [Clostridiaceae bacterium]|nr:helix-turn-helix transcriptional regulator [Clostridiaceae bacterium]
MTRRRRGSKIYKNFIISYIVTLMVPMFIMSFIVLFHYANVLKDEVETNLRNPFIKSVENFDAQINQLTRTSLQIELNDILRTVDIKERPYDAVKIKNELLKYSTNSFVNDIFLYSYKDDYISAFNFLCSLDIFNDFILNSELTDFSIIEFKESSKQSGMYYFPIDSIYLANKENHLMYLNKLPINNTNSYGIIMYMIPQEALKNVLAPAISENNHLFIVDPETKEILFTLSENPNPELAEIFNHTIKSNNDIENITEIEIHGDKYSPFVQSSSKAPYLFVQLMPDDLLSSRINQIRTVYFISMAVIIVISGFLIAILMRINYRPIKRLNQFLEDNFQHSKETMGDKLNELEQLEYVLIQYDKENTDLKEFASASKDAVKSYLIDCFLLGQAREIDNIIEICSKAELEFEMDYYCTLIIKSNNIQNASNEEVINILSSIINNSQIILHRDIHSSNFVVLFGSDLNDDKHAHIISQKIQESLNEEYDGDVRIGMGNFYKSIFDINLSYEEALRVLEYNSLLSKPKIIRFNDILNKDVNSINYPFSLFDELESSVYSSDIFAINDNINKLVYHMKNENLSIFWVKNICYDTVNTISKVLLKKYNHSPLISKHYLEKIYGSNISTFDDISEIMKEISEDITNYLSVDKESYELKLLQQIVHYIRENFQNPEFGLQNIADSLQMSPPYLSQYFKKNTGYTISEYVTRLRMEKAKDLLKNSDLSVNDIANEVGYYSVPSFIRKFKEIEQITPGKYKKKYS